MFLCKNIQMMIFLYVCSTFSVVELKNAIGSWILRYEVNGVYSSHLQIICAKYSTYKLYVKRMYTTYFISCYSGFKSRFLVQLRWMTSKHIRIVSFGGRHFSSPYLTEVILRSTIQTKKTLFGKFVQIVNSGMLNNQNYTVIK
jgi:hypothetical protein